MTKSKFTLCIGLFVSSAFATADEAANLTRSMQASMDKYCAAVVKRDFKAADKIILANFASDCKFVSAGKVMDLKTWMTLNNQQLVAMSSITKLSMKLSKVKVTGSRASSVENFLMVANVKDNKKISVLRVTASNVTAMQKRNGKWLCTMVTSTPGKMMIDGKPINFSGSAKTKSTAP